MSAPSTKEGMVVRSESGFFTVLLDPGTTVVCRLRGRLLKERSDVVNLVTIGDRVEVALANEAEGSIEAVLPRRTELARRAAGPGRRRWLRQPLAANLDLVVVVASVLDPAFNAARLDRFLVVTEDAEIQGAICLNKCDLASEAEVAACLASYRESGYPQLCTSAVSGTGLPDLRALLHGRLRAFVGASGTGKSSLLNVLIPGSRLRTGDVSAATGRGRHTTTVGQLLALDATSWVADTPGLRELAPWGLQRDRLPWLFPEFRPVLERPCRFPACTHRHEPGCRVLEAVERGGIPASRHASYVKLWDEAT